MTTDDFDPTQFDLDEEMEAVEPRPDMAATLDLLRQGVAEGVVPAKVYYGLSDVSDEELDALAAVWAELPGEYRVQVMRRLAEHAEANYEFDYAGLARLAAEIDPDGDVRIAAIDVLALDEDRATMVVLLAMTSDSSPAIRAAALGALANFVLLGEYDELQPQETARLHQVIVAALNNDHEPVEVRRRALETIANSSLDEVNDAIRTAYGSAERPMQISAIFAMGRSLDEDAWSKMVISELESDDVEMRFQAVRSAGELGLERAVPALKRIVFDNDAEMRDMAIWSLGEVGGKRALDTLNLLARDAEQVGDEDLVALIEDAIATAQLGNDNLYLMKTDD